MKEYKNKLSLIAFDLSECADVMPNTLNKHKSAVYNACLDMIHHFEPILKEVHNNALKMVEEGVPKKLEGWTGNGSDLVERTEINVHNGFRNQVINNIQKLKI